MFFVPVGISLPASPACLQTDRVFKRSLVPPAQFMVPQRCGAIEASLYNPFLFRETTRLMPGQRRDLCLDSHPCHATPSLCISFGAGPHVRPSPLSPAFVAPRDSGTTNLYYTRISFRFQHFLRQFNQPSTTKGAERAESLLQKSGQFSQDVDSMPE